MATFINGFGGTVTIGTKTLSVTEWTLKVDNGLIDVTNVSSSNYGQYIGGINSGQVSIKAFWDTDDVYTSPTNSLVPGTTGTATLRIGSSGKSVAVSVIIMSISLGNSPAAGVTFDLECKLITAPTYPS